MIPIFLYLVSSFDIEEEYYDSSFQNNAYKISETGELTLIDDYFKTLSNLVIEGTGTEGITIVGTSLTSTNSINIKLKGIIHINENAFSDKIQIDILRIHTTPDCYSDLANIPDIFNSLYFEIEDAKDDDKYPLTASFQNHKKLESVTLDKHITEIIDNAFKDCTSLSSEMYTFNSVLKIGAYAFYNTNFESISFDYLQECGDYCLAECPRLKYLYFNTGSSICKIGSHILGDKRQLDEFVLTDLCEYKEDSFNLDFVGDFTYHLYNSMTKPATFSFISDLFFVVAMGSDKITLLKDGFASVNILREVAIYSPEHIEVPRIFGKIDSAISFTIRGLVTFTEQPYLSAQNLASIDFIIEKPNEFSSSYFENLPYEQVTQLTVTLEGAQQGQVPSLSVSFERFSNVESLELGMFFDVTIKTGLFTKLTKLKKLYVKSEKSITFENNIFPSSFTHLIYERDSTDLLEFIPKENVEILELKGMQQLTIPKDLLNGFKKVTTLSLSNSILTIVEGNPVLDGISQLTSFSYNADRINLNQEFINGFENLKNLTIKASSNDVSTIVNMFNIEKLEVLRLILYNTATFRTKSVKVFTNLKHIGIPCSKTESNLRQLKSEAAGIDLSIFDDSSITSVEYLSTDDSNTANYNTKELFGNHPINEITFGYNVVGASENVLSGYDKLTVNIDTTFRDLNSNLFSSVKDLTINAAEKGESYSYVDGIFYDDTMTFSCVAVKEEEVRIPEGVVSIPKEMFEGNTVVKSITLPETTKRIAESAFKDCTSMESLNCESSNVEFEGNGNIFAEDAKVEITVPNDYEGNNFGGSTNVNKQDPESPSPDTTPTPTPEDKPLSAGAIAGIVIAVVVVVGAVIAGVVFYLHKKKSNGEQSAEEREEKEPQA